jgi:hypothetical protein
MCSGCFSSCPGVGFTCCSRVSDVTTANGGRRSTRANDFTYPAQNFKLVGDRRISAGSNSARTCSTDSDRSALKHPS